MTGAIVNTSWLYRTCKIRKMGNLGMILSLVTCKQFIMKVMCWYWKWEFTKHNDKNAKKGSKENVSKTEV